MFAIAFFGQINLGIIFEWQLTLRIVRRLPACAQLSEPAELMGRCWTILEGGNRGNVLMRSAVAVRYGD